MRHAGVSFVPASAPERVAPLPLFESGAFNLSATLPDERLECSRIPLDLSFGILQVMQHKKTADTYIIKIERDEPVIGTLTDFCQREGIKNASFSAIGAAKNVTCGYYALDEKKYYFTDYPEIVEVVSLTGNVMLKEGSPFLHVHAVFTDTKNEAFGGHVKEMTVGVVLEVVLRVYDTNIARELDEDIGLFLMNCGE